MAATCLASSAYRPEVRRALEDAAGRSGFVGTGWPRSFSGTNLFGIVPLPGENRPQLVGDSPAVAVGRIAPHHARVIANQAPGCATGLASSACPGIDSERLVWGCPVARREPPPTSWGLPRCDSPRLGRFVTLSTAVHGLICEWPLDVPSEMPLLGRASHAPEGTSQHESTCSRSRRTTFRLELARTGAGAPRELVFEVEPRHWFR